MLHDVFSTARALGFKGIAVDITYGARNTSRDDVLEELECLLELKPDRILCHAAQTSFAENDEHHISDQPKPLSQAAKLSMFVSMLDVFELCGYEWVGVSGFALPGDAWCEAQAEGRLYRNWIGYTTERAFSVLGFGLGAVHRATWFDCTKSRRPTSLVCVSNSGLTGRRQRCGAEYTEG